MKENKYRKYITFSFDDGNFDDIRLVELLDKYHIKATFNIDSALMSGLVQWTWEDKKKQVNHIPFSIMKKIYKNHEVAGHSYSHPDLTRIDSSSLDNELFLDKQILSSLFNNFINGFAYPFGAYNDDVIKALKKYSYAYARTVNETHAFSLPKNFYIWNPTCRFLSDTSFDLAETFLNDNSDEILLFYIWGHSYELVTESDWKLFESFLKKIANHDDVFYGTNIEIYKQIKRYHSK